MGLVFRAATRVAAELGGETMDRLREQLRSDRQPKLD